MGMRLAGKAAVITGASTGIGRASALRFAEEGARLVLVDVRESEGTGLAREVQRRGGTACYVRADVSERGDNERPLDLCVERYGTLDILFCNAGVTLPKVLPESTDEEIERLLAVNLLGPMYAARHAIPIMLAQPQGGSGTAKVSGEPSSSAQNRAGTVTVRGGSQWQAHSSVTESAGTVANAFLMIVAP